MKRRLGLMIFCATTVGDMGLAAAQPAAPAPAPTTAAPAAAPPPEITFDGHTMRIGQVGSSVSVDIGCTGRQAVRLQDRIFVACGKGGVVAVNVSNPQAPRREGSMAVDGDATSVFLHDGGVWVQVEHDVEARPVRIGSSSPTPTPTAGEPPPLPPPPETHAPVVTVAPPRNPEEPPPGGEVEVPLTGGAEAEAPGITAPPRRGDLWDISLFTSAFVAFGSLGGGLLGSGSVAYRFDAPVVLRVEAIPFALGSPAVTTTTGGGFTPGIGTPTNNRSTGSATAFGAHAVIGLDTQLIEVGLGIGGVTINQGSSTGSQPQSGAVSIAQEARIGARDGLALNVETSAVALSNRFDLGYFISSFQIPVSRTVMLVIRGGGGSVGFGYGDVGVRVRIRGDNGKGTIALSGYAGGDFIGMNLCASNSDPPFTSTCTTASLAGPALGGGIEWKR